MNYRLESFYTGNSSVNLPQVETQGSVGTGGSNLRVARTLTGMFDYDGSGRAMAAWPINETHRGAVIESSLAAMDTSLAAYRTLRGRQGVLYRVNDVGAHQFCIARCLQVDAQRETSRNLYYMPLTFTFARQSIWYGSYHGATAESPTFGLALAGTDAKHTFSTVFRSTIYDGDILYPVNSGDATVETAIFNLIPLSNPITAVRVQCSSIYRTDAIDWTYTGSIAVGAQLRIDCSTWAVTVNSADAYAGFALNAAHTAESWLPLDPGTSDYNPLTINYPNEKNDSADVWVEFFDGYE